MSILGPDQLYAVQTKSLQTIQNEQHDAEANLGETTSLLKGHVVQWSPFQNWSTSWGDLAMEMNQIHQFWGTGGH